MTTPSRVGFTQVNASAGDYSASHTVPADCNLVVAFWSHWNNNSSQTASALSIGGQSMSIVAQRAEGATTNANGVGVAILVNPPTGSQTHTLTWSNSGARLEGGELVFVYYKGANTADPYRAVAVNSGTSGNSANSSLANVDATDRVVGFLSRYVSAGSSVISPVTAFIDEASANSNIYDVGDRTGLSGTVDIDNTGTDYFSATAGIALKASAGTTEYDPLSASGAISLSSYSGVWTDPNNRFTLVSGNGGIEANTQAVDVAWYNAGTFSADQFAEIELVNPSGGSDYIGPAVRCSAGAGNNGYWFYAALGAGLWYWGHLVNGTYTTVGNGSTTGWAAGDVLRIEVKGTTVRLKRNGVQIGSDYTGRTECSTGRPGIAGYHNSAGTGTNGKNWVGGDLLVPTSWGYRPNVQHILHNPR